MTKINTNLNKAIAGIPIQTHEGAPAKRITPEQQLNRSVLACMLWEDSFYESGESIANRIVEGVKNVSPEYASQLAITARSKFYLRHVPLLICDTLAKEGELKAAVLAEVIQRPDELGEFLAIYWRNGKQPLAAQVKKGLAKAFTKFNEYSLAKYNSRKAGVKLRDVMFLCHPKPTSEEQASLWKRLVDGKMISPETWENQLSAGKDKKEAWTNLILENKLGGLALLRNLRNIQEVGVTEEIIRQGIQQANFAKVLPFRFIAAARYAARFEPEIEKAMLKSLDTTVKLAGKTILLIDTSGSMVGGLSKKSDLNRSEAAIALAILLREICSDIEIISFAGQPNQVPARRGFALRDAIDPPTGGTNTEDAKKFADSHGYDRIIIITDEQSHQVISNPRGLGYVINVAAYKNGVGYGKWTHIDGWSEAVINYIQELEAGSAE